MFGCYIELNDVLFAHALQADLLQLGKDELLHELLQVAVRGHAQVVAEEDHLLGALD